MRPYALFFAIAVAGGAQAAPIYRIVELAGFPGSWGSWANDIGASGHVAGYAADDFGEYRALVWDARGQLTNLGGTGPYSSKAYGVSERGLVCGWLDQRTGNAEPVIWVKGVPTYLPVLPGHIGGVCYDVNDNGQAVGVSVTWAGDRVAVAWNNGQISALASNHSWPSQINCLGQSAGIIDTTSFPRPAFLSPGNPPAPLPGLGDGDGYANDIDDSGAVIGTARHPFDGFNHAVRWRAGVPQDLGVIFAASRGVYVGGMNNRGDFVGTWFPPTGNYRPFAVLDRQPVDLLPQVRYGMEIWSELYEVRDINDRGEIIGMGYRNGGMWFDRAFRLIPVGREDRR